MQVVTGIKLIGLSIYIPKETTLVGTGYGYVHDKTGRQGPADWEVGNYLEGKDNHPVTGISWYEAMAYAKFVRKNYLRFIIGFNRRYLEHHRNILRSNFNGKGTVPVGSLME
jgi:hypothetical protein